MDIMDDVVWKIIVTVIGSLLITGILWLIREIRRLVKLIERHEKVLFGDTDISDWSGLVKIAISTRQYSIIERKALVLLIQILCRNKTIEMDSDLSEVLNLLKKE